MAYDPYQFAAARSNIAGNAAQGVGQALQQITGAIGEVAQQKIDHKQLVNDYKTKILPSAIKALVDNYDIPEAQAGIIAAKAFPDPSVFGKDDKAAKTHYINQTTKIDDIAQTYLKHQDYKANKEKQATAEATRVRGQEEANNIFSGAAPAGSALATPQIDAPAQQTPIDPTTNTGWSRAEMSSPETSVSDYGAPAGNVQAPPAGSVQTTLAGSAQGPYQEDLDKKARVLSHEGATAYTQDPRRSLYPKQPQMVSEYDAKMAELEMRLLKARIKEKEASASTAVSGKPEDSAVKYASNEYYAAQNVLDKAKKVAALLDKAAKEAALKGVLSEETSKELSGEGIVINQFSPKETIQDIASYANAAVTKAEAGVDEAKKRKPIAAKHDKTVLGRVEQELISNEQQAISDIASHMGRLYKDTAPMSNVSGDRVTERVAMEYAAAKGYSPESAKAAHDQFLRSRAGIAGSVTGGSFVSDVESEYFERFKKQMIEADPRFENLTEEEQMEIFQEAVVNKPGM